MKKPTGNASRSARVARDKIKPIETLGEIARQVRAEGKTVVLCHGVFDLVHMGHVRHLEAARREGDVLMVTLTANRHVHKGPGRPIFPAELRAEMIAALEYVDWVGINDSPTSELVLRTLCPNVYVKGSDYENPDDDITGGIVSEREAVEQQGGRIIFTKDVTFSSSSLINRYLHVYDRPLQDYLESMRETDAAQRILDLIERVRDFRVLVVGDAIIDQYDYVDPMGKSAKENIIATRFRDRESFAGGVFATANNVANLCAEVEIITCLGGEDSHEDLIRASLKPNVKLSHVVRPDAPTTRKLRYVSPSYIRKLFEIYYFNDTPLPKDVEKKLNDLILARIDHFDLVIANDFGHGLIGPSTVDLLKKGAKFLAVNTQTNSANLGYNLITKYKNPDFACIDAPEAQMAARDRFSSIETLTAEILPDLVGCDKFIVTHGREGCVTYDRRRGVSTIPAFTKTVIDTVGAGDAFLAATAPLVAAGGSIEDAGFVGNAAGAIKVGIVGHRSSLEKIPLLRFIATLLK